MCATIFKTIEWNMWPLLRWQGFSMIWPSELVFDRSWPIFNLDIEIIKINVHNNFQDDWMNKRAMMALYRSPESHWLLCKNDHDISKERDLCKVHTKQTFKTSVFQYNCCEEFYIFGQCDLVFILSSWKLLRTCILTTSKSDLKIGHFGSKTRSHCPNTCM